MKHSIKNIIFDLGGVLFDIDYTLTIAAFASIGVKDFEKIFAKKAQSELFNHLEEGKISAAEFTQELSKISDVALKTEQVVWALNTMLFNIPTERLTLLKDLRKNYRLFLYSNINEIHAAEVHRLLFEKHGLLNLEKHFEKVYYSHEIGARKPNPEGFLQIIREQQLNPAETLFIDDSPQHVKGAQEVSLQALWLDLEQHNIHDLIQANGL